MKYIIEHVTSRSVAICTDGQPRSFDTKEAALNWLHGALGTDSGHIAQSITARDLEALEDEFYEDAN